MSSRRRRECHKRLRKEYQNLLATPIENCSAAPSENNIQVWHANIMSTHESLAGVPFHFTIEFPDKYPERAPKIRNCSNISHKNVFDNYICLDILTMSEETSKTPYRGWSAAYTISSLLVQLQSFLFETEAKGSALTRMRREAKSFTCSCGHSFRNICPEITTFIEAVPRCLGIYKTLAEVPIRRHRTMNSGTGRSLETGKEYSIRYIDGDELLLSNQEGWVSLFAPDGSVQMRFVRPHEEPTTEYNGFNFIEEMFEVVQQDIFSFCDLDTLAALELVSDEFRETIARSKHLMQRQFRCFYTLRELHEDPELVLGFGARQFRMGRRSRKTGRMNEDVLQQLHPSFDLMSWEAFDQHQVRTNVWKDCDTLDSFIPLYINNEHGRRSLPLAKICFQEMFRHHSFSPKLALDALSKLMNTTVVNMMKSVDDLESGELQMVDSIKALEGYMSFHHLLLAFTNEYPSLENIANEKIEQFINNPLARDKEITPDMGELLCYLAISRFSWEEFVPAWLEEGFQRNARWILAKFPNLLNEEDEFSCIRLHQSYRASRTGMRLAMFQRFFMTEIASPSKLNSDPKKLQILFNQYNSRLGKPAEGMAEKLQDHSRMVLDCDNYFHYFELMGFAAPTAKMIWKWLKNSDKLSKTRQYHQNRLILRHEQHHMVFPWFDLHLDTRNCACAGERVYRVDEETGEVQKIDGVPVLVDGPDGPICQGESKQLDLVFCIDCTGSMHSWIHVAKRKIKEIIRLICRKTTKKVRFGLVAYRDHEQEGWGEDSFLLRIHDFTNDLEQINRDVQKLSAGGGADYPEAMCCALDAVHNLSWNRSANQVVILIADAPPHGLDSDHYRVGDDSFPSGCPCGHDSLRNIHTMAQQGIAVYPVDCGRPDGRRQTLFQAFARITGACCLPLKDAALLPEIVLAAALEEGAMDKLAKKVKPILKQINKHHNIAREEQVVYQVHAELTAKNVKVETKFPTYNFDKYTEKQIESLAFCMDLRQAKAVCKDTRMRKIPERDFHLGNSKVKTPVTRDHVKRCLKRIDLCDAEELVLAGGCQYRKNRWSVNETKKRWRVFREKVPQLGAFKPWRTLKEADFKCAEVIPSQKDFKSTRPKVAKIRNQPSRKKPAAKPAPWSEPSPAPKPMAVAPARVCEEPAPKPITVASAPVAVQPAPMVVAPAPVFEETTPAPTPMTAAPAPVVVEAEPVAAIPVPMVAQPTSEVSPQNARRSRSRSVERISTSLFSRGPVAPAKNSNASTAKKSVAVAYGCCTLLHCGKSRERHANDFVGQLENGQVIRVAEIVGNRARIVSPFYGWVSTHDNFGRPLIVQLSAQNMETLERGEPYGTRTSLRVRAGQALNTAWVGDIPAGEVVRVAEIRGMRARIVSPFCGWIFTKNDKMQDLIVKLRSSQIRVRSLSQASSSVNSVGQVTPIASRSGSVNSRSSSVNRNVAPTRTGNATPLHSRPRDAQNIHSTKRAEPTVIVDFVAWALSEKQLKQRLALRGIHVKEVRICRRTQSHYTAELTFKSQFAAKTAAMTKGMIVEGLELAFCLPKNNVAGFGSSSQV